MAVSLLAHEVSDLCLGKPALRSLPVSATVADTLAALKLSGDTCISIWSCDHSPAALAANCRCVGKVCMVDVICFLCRDENLSSPASALKSPVSALLPNTPNLVIHVEPCLRLLDAIELIVQGARNLVVPIRARSAASRRKLVQQQQQKPHIAGTTTSHKGREFCWLSEEDVVRFLLSSIGSFSPLPALSIHALGIVRPDVLAVNYHSPVAPGLIARSLTDRASVAVVDDCGCLIGEISPFALSCCDETVAYAVTTLSAGDLMAYIDGGDPPVELVRAVKAGLRERNLVEMLGQLDAWPGPTSSGWPSCSEDEEGSGVSSARRFGRSWSYSARMARRAEAIVCGPGSSLAAVMIQAIAHRVNYVWVEDGGLLAGIVTFSDMLRVFRDYLEAMDGVEEE